jgi:hypothetical protein
LHNVLIEFGVPIKLVRLIKMCLNEIYTVKPTLNGISRVQNIFPLKPGFSLIKVYYDSHGT